MINTNICSDVRMIVIVSSAVQNRVRPPTPPPMSNEHDSLCPGVQRRHPVLLGPAQYPLGEDEAGLHARPPSRARGESLAAQPRDGGQAAPGHRAGERPRHLQEPHLQERDGSPLGQSVLQAGGVGGEG